LVARADADGRLLAVDGVSSTAKCGAEARRGLITGIAESSSTRSNPCPERTGTIGAVRQTAGIERNTLICAGTAGIGRQGNAIGNNDIAPHGRRCARNIGATVGIQYDGIGCSIAGGDIIGDC